MPDDPASVSAWRARLKAGGPAAAQPLSDRYFDQLVRLARARLAGRPCRVADESDVALSAFASFCRAAAAGRFPHLDDRNDLRALFLTLIKRKVNALVDRETARKRGGGAVRGDSASGADVAGREPSPDIVVQHAETLAELLGRLEAQDAWLRRIAEMKFEGYTNNYCTPPRCRH
jgi:hypothetical protein